MQITEVRIKLMEDSDDRLQGFCSITFDDSFVVRDLKIIEGTSGPFVAMPSRKLTGHCNHCGSKNHLKAQFCNQCGGRQREDRLIRDADGRAKLYADIAHPINSSCREMIQNRVIAEYFAERERAKQPGYISRYDDDYAFDAGEAYDVPPEHPQISEPTHSHSAMSPASGITETRVDQPHTTTEPHRAPATRPETASRHEELRTPHQKPARKTGDFGAGIFE